MSSVDARELFAPLGVSAGDTPAVVPDEAHDDLHELFDRLVVKAVDRDFSRGPLLLTASFDGSQRFSMWLDTLKFARDLPAPKPPRFTYFVNSCYYDPTVSGSLIGKAYSRPEVLARPDCHRRSSREGQQ